MMSSFQNGNGQQTQVYLPEGGQLIRLPNGQMQVITPTPTQVQQPTNQGLILVSRSNQQVKKTKVIICTNIYGDSSFKYFRKFLKWCNLKLFQVKIFVLIFTWNVPLANFRQLTAILDKFPANNPVESNCFKFWNVSSNIEHCNINSSSNPRISSSSTCSTGNTTAQSTGHVTRDDFQPTDEPTTTNPISEIKTEIETDDVTTTVTSDANQSQGQIRVEDIMMESRTEGDNLIGKTYPKPNALSRFFQ